MRTLVFFHIDQLGGFLYGTEGGSQTFLLLIHTTAGLNLATTVYSPESIEQCVDIANTLTIQGTQPAQKEYITEMPLVDRNNAADYINPASRY